MVTSVGLWPDVRIALERCGAGAVAVVVADDDDDEGNAITSIVTEAVREPDSRPFKTSGEATEYLSLRCVIRMCARQHKTAKVSYNRPLRGH